MASPGSTPSEQLLCTELADNESRRGDQLHATNESKSDGDSRGAKYRSLEIIHRYLIANCTEFKDLKLLRDQTENNPFAVQYFKQQRERADKADGKRQRYFYTMMKQIAEEMNEMTSGFIINRTKRQTILDMCMAPGGFLSKAKQLNPRARAVAFTLPHGSGGHRVLMPKPERNSMDLKQLDVTLLVGDLDRSGITDEQLEADNFITERMLLPERLFDLVLCDGQVLRTHERPVYREIREPVRLSSAQLAIGMEHLRPGGTFIMLLHEVEAWRNVRLLHLFSKISEVQLFKSDKHHKTRSSFYLVAKNVGSQHELARDAVRLWKTKWRVATFGTDEELKKLVYYDHDEVESLLGVFGADLIELGRGIWTIERDALANANFTRKYNEFNDRRDTICMENPYSEISVNVKKEENLSSGAPGLNSAEEPQEGESSETNDGCVTRDVEVAESHQNYR